MSRDLIPLDNNIQTGCNDDAEDPRHYLVSNLINSFEEKGTSLMETAERGEVNEAFLLVNEEHIPRNTSSHISGGKSALYEQHPCPVSPSTATLTSTVRAARRSSRGLCRARYANNAEAQSISEPPSSVASRRHASDEPPSADSVIIWN
ncbi:hypothetical protein MSG28_011248 [Choristoneura fumiferana]|uniref:Uncharacterized protein n=1 Tax=Choristoneura fumiferana TaxID=7141 RepID=A0ACC0KRW9_CHOFU|nr:hypothetical protein MSG28_011248 [Choristoneura fumiferana]